MLHNISVNHFASFQDGFQLSFASEENVNHTDHVFDDGNNKILRLSLIFGKNGSGKTNFVNSIKLLKSLITDSKKYTDKQLIRTLAEYLGPEENTLYYTIDFTNNHHTYSYNYGINIRNKESEEAIYLIDSEKKKLLLSKEKNSIKSIVSEVGSAEYRTLDYNQLLPYISNRLCDIDKAYKKEKKQQRNELGEIWILKNGMFWNHYLSDVKEWFSKINIVDSDSINISKPNLRNAALLLNYFDTDICKIEATDITDQINEMMVSTETIQEKKINISTYKDYLKSINCPAIVRNKNGRPMVKGYTFLHNDGINYDWFEESEGTLRLMEFTDLVYGNEEDSLFIVDEFDRKIHPLVVREMIDLFINKKQKRQQLLFTTHETTLIDPELIRNDEINIVKNDVKKSSKIVSLSDYEIIYLFTEEDYLSERYNSLFETREA